MTLSRCLRRVAAEAAGGSGRVTVHLLRFPSSLSSRFASVEHGSRGTWHQQPCMPHAKPMQLRRVPTRSGEGVGEKHTCALLGPLLRPSAQSGERESKYVFPHNAAKGGPSESRQSPSLVKRATQTLAQNTQQCNVADGELLPKSCLNLLCNTSIHEDTTLGVNRCASAQHLM